MIYMTVVLLPDCIDSAQNKRERVNISAGKYFCFDFNHQVEQTLFAPNCTLAFPLTKVALICMMTDSIEVGTAPALWDHIYVLILDFYSLF